MHFDHIRVDCSLMYYFHFLYIKFVTCNLTIISLPISICEIHYKMVQKLPKQLHSIINETNLTKQHFVKYLLGV